MFGLGLRELKVSKYSQDAKLIFDGFFENLTCYTNVF